MREPALVLSCEHGGNRVPARWQKCFEGRTRLLATHRGYDLGAAELAAGLGRAFGVTPIVHRVTRLLVDANRSLTNSSAFSEFTAELPAEERERIVAEVWSPHRERVRAELHAALKRHPILHHVGVHSFTPVRAGKRRPMHLALLYDPARARETAFARRWQKELRERLPQLVVHRNAPYRGDSDGLTRSMRRELGERYLGVELEVRHDRLRTSAAIRALIPPIAAALRAALSS